MQANIETVNEKINTTLAQIVGENNVDKARFGILCAAGGLSAWLFMRQCCCGCLRYDNYNNVEKTEKIETVPAMRGMGFFYGIQVPHSISQKIIELEKQTPGIFKRMFRCFFCIKSAKQKNVELDSI